MLGRNIPKVSPLAPLMGAPLLYRCHSQFCISERQPVGPHKDLGDRLDQAYFLPMVRLPTLCLDESNNRSNFGRGVVLLGFPVLPVGVKMSHRNS